MESKNTSDKTNVNPKPSTISLALVLNLVISCFFLFTAVLAVIHVRSVMRQHVLEDAESKTRIILDHNLATHTYFSHDLKPAVFELTDPYISPDYFDPTWMSSTYAVREIDRYYRALSDKDYYYKEAAINARSPQNEADPFERDFIEALNADPSLVDQSLVRTLNGKPYFVTIRRGEVLESSCLRCHSTPENAPSELIDLYGPERSFQRNVGEVISAISIRIPLSEAYAAVDQVTWQLSGVLLVFLFGLFFIQAFVYIRFVLRPLGHMRDKARQIAAGDVPIGEQIVLPFGKELAEFASVFNAMSIALRQEKEQLEDRIQERTLSLAQTNQLLQEDIATRKRAEEALRESEEIFRAFINQSNDAIALTNSDGIIVEWNPALTRITGTSREQALGQPLWIVESWHFDDNNSSAVEQLTKALEAMIRQALAGETAPWLGKLTEMPIRHLDNTQRVVQSVSFPINTQHHRMLGTIMRDITERKRIEETLREKTEELDRFFSLALDLLCIANVDGYFLRLNNAWETTLGYRLEDLQGKRFLDLVHPDDLESTLGAIAALSADQQILNFVNRYRCQDGSYRWIEWRSVPYQGRLIYAAARDITERRQMEETLRQSEQQYRTLFDQSTNALLLCEAVIDEQGTPTDFVVLQTNRVFEDSVNVRAQDMVGQHLTHVFPNIKDTSLFNAMIRTATTRQPEQLEFHSVSLSRHFDVGVFSPHQGQVATSYADITARKQVEEHKARLALEQEKARILQSFVEDVSHEFRTPLTVIHSGLQLLEQMAAHQRTQSPERIAELEEQTMYISDLVDAMLTMTKLDSVSSLPTTATAINSVVATVAETFQPYAAKKEVMLRLETMEESPLVLGVSDELELTVGNLVKNAIQFTPPNGRVTVRTSADSYHAIIEISDTGTGISEEALPLIFERFYRANTARTGRHAGLGLAIAKRIIELHAGQIEVTSQLNEGSTFRVLLPLANEPESRSENQ
jgi:PAS domain S-box-containing protein